MDINITGPRVVFELPFFGGIPVSETVVVTWIIMAVLIIGSIVLTRNMQRVPTKKQLVAESYVGLMINLVTENMGAERLSYMPYIATLFILSIVSNLISLIGFRAPTADFNTTLAWALMTTFLIHRAKFKNGLGSYLKGYAEPFLPMLPLNVVGELSTPISLAFRHYGNLVAGTVITTLLYGVLATLTTQFFNVAIPFLQLGLPAFLSFYLDLFTGFIQAFIFSTLSMVLIAIGLDD